MEEQDGIRERRKRNAMRQDELAGMVGVTREYLGKIEQGKRTPSPELLEKIDYFLELYNPEKQLEIILDYVRIRFPTKDVRYIIEDVLRVKMEHMVREGHAFYGYGAQYILGDITVMYSDDEQKGVLLELKGRGCRQFESYLEAQGRTWYEFLAQARDERAFIKRIDLAINDRAGFLNVPELVGKCEREEYVTLFRGYKHYRSGELFRAEEDAEEMGNTLYLGSMRSEIYFCIYEKDYEQYVKNGIPLEETEIKNRFEIRLKDSRAEHAVDDLLMHEDAGSTAFGIINRYVTFLCPNPKKKRRNWDIDPAWARFMGEERRNIKLTTKPEPYTLDRSLNWITRQVAPTLKMVRLLDASRGEEDKIDLAINAAKLGVRHEKILEQQMIGEEEMIL